MKFIHMVNNYKFAKFSVKCQWVVALDGSLRVRDSEKSYKVGVRFQSLFVREKKPQDLVLKQT